MIFSLRQGCDGQAISVDLRTDVHHSHYRYIGLFPAHRRPHVAVGHFWVYLRKNPEHLKNMCLYPPTSLYAL